MGLPILISFSLGYTLNWSSRSVEKSGGIFIKSRTPRLSIFLNNNFIKETSLISSGAILTRIYKGTYLLRIEKDGYHPWSKAVTVEPEVVTELRNILLVTRPITVATTTKKEVSSLLATSTPSWEITLDKKRNLIERGSKKIISSAVNSYGMLDNKILVINESGFLSVFDLSTNLLETIGRPGFYLSQNMAKFTQSPAGEITILDSSGGIYLWNGEDNIHPVDGGAKTIYFDEDGEKMLMVKENEIEILWMKNNPNQPFQKKYSQEIILRVTSPIEDARWLYQDNAHIAIKTADGIFLTEIDGRGGRNTVELFSGKTDEIFTSPEVPQAVFFKQGKIWQKIEL